MVMSFNLLCVAQKALTYKVMYNVQMVHMYVYTYYMHALCYVGALAEFSGDSEDANRDCSALIKAKHSSASSAITLNPG